MKLFDKKTIVYDMNFLMHRSRAIAAKNLDTTYLDKEKLDDIDYITFAINRFALHITFNDIMDWNKQFQPDEVVCAFDSKNVWRKEYYKIYKQQRVEKRKKESKEEFNWNMFHEALQELNDIITTQSNWKSIQIDGLEGDDILYLISKYSDPSETVILVTSDKDLQQVFRFDNVKLYNPLSKSYRTLKDLKINNIKFDDIKTWMFAKIITGDAKDNVGKVFEGKRIGPAKAKKLFAPQNDFTELKELFEKYKGTHDIFNLNGVLLDLEKIPKKYHQQVIDARKNAKLGEDYDFQTFLAYLQKYELRGIMDNLDRFLETF